jgi:hypothetical protein
MSPHMPRANAKKNRLPASLSHKIDQRLLAYAAAASAAGASMLAMVQPSQAEIVFTPTHKMVPMGGRLALDLNNDGITDFTLYNNLSSCHLPSVPGAPPPECSQYTRQMLVLQGNTSQAGVWAGKGGFASVLVAGAKIGSGAPFAQFASMERCSTQQGEDHYTSGPWINVQNRYLGLAFTISGQVHYGWARLSVTIKAGTCRPAIVVLTGYAYETEPGKSIPAGKRSDAAEQSSTEQPQGTLGMLAQGNVGLDIWRRD